ncbi:MAG TPA: class I SAM-dependent methyltransferase [Desulfobacterales bacterium]|nr:class I SAM-dependent methyltransferase [Desulfobacterales bacterium]
MEILITRNVQEFHEATKLFKEHLEPLGRIMDEEVQRGGTLGRLRLFQDYRIYWRWPIRQLEYSFILRNCLPLLKKGLRTLDVGCGVTPLPIFFAQQGCEAYGIDSDCAIIQLLQSNVEKIYHTKVHYSCQNATCMNFEDENFDLITCVSVLEHLESGKDTEAVQEMLRVLKPGGRLLLTVDFRPAFLQNRPKRLIRKVVRGFQLVLSLRIAELYSRLRSPIIGCYTIADINYRLIQPFRKYYIRKELQDSEEISLPMIRQFWNNHWYPGCLFKKNEKNYVSVGLIYEKRK